MNALMGWGEDYSNKSLSTRMKDDGIFFVNTTRTDAGRPWDEGKVKPDTGVSTKEGRPTRREQLAEDPIGFKKGKLNIMWRPPAERKQDAEDEFEENEHKRDRFGRFTRGSFSPAPMAQPDLSKQRLVKAFREQGRKLDPSLSTGDAHRAAKTKAELFHQPGQPDHIRKHSLPSHNLSRGLLEALNRYTEEAWGKDVSYYTMNQSLQAGELPSDDPDSELSTEIDSVQAALLALPPYQHSGPDAALYRSMPRYAKRSNEEIVSEEFLQTYENAVGDIIQDPAFVSTSNDVSGATAFGRGKGGVMFVVKPDPNAQGESVGRDIKPYSQAPGENEILFPHGAYFKVAGVYRGDGRRDPKAAERLGIDDAKGLSASDDDWIVAADPQSIGPEGMAGVIEYRDKMLDAMGASHLKKMLHDGMVPASRIDAVVAKRKYGENPTLFKDLDEDEKAELLVKELGGIDTKEDALARLSSMAPGDEIEEYIASTDATKKGILELGPRGYVCAAEIAGELQERRALKKPDFDNDPRAHGSEQQYARAKVADMYTKSATSYLESSLTTVDDDDAIVSDPDKFLARSEKILEHFDQNPKLLGDMSVTELYDYIDKAGSDLMEYFPGLGDYMTPKALTALSDGRMTPKIKDAVKFIDSRKQVARALGTDAARLIVRTYAAVWKNPDLGQYQDPLTAATHAPVKVKRALPPELQYLDSYPSLDKSVSIIVLEEVNAKFTSSVKRGKQRKDAEGLPLALAPQIMADFILGADPLTDIQGWTELEVLQEGGALASFLLSEYLPGAEGRWDTIVAPDVLRRVILSADPMVNISPWDETEVAGEAQAILTFLMEEYRRSSIEDLLKTPADYIPQDAAQYTEASTEPEATCKECFAYLDTRRCRIVRGHISPYGKCALWESATPLLVNRNDDNKPVQRIVDWQGLKLGLQYLPGDIRHGKRITAAYGNVRGTYGQADDGMAFDVWVNLKGGDRCFKLQQLTDEGEHDEFKYILGASSLDDAKAIYAANMPSRLMGEVVECEVDELAPVVKRKDAKDFDEGKVARDKKGQFSTKNARAMKYDRRVHELISTGENFTRRFVSDKDWKTIRHIQGIGATGVRAKRKMLFNSDLRQEDLINFNEVSALLLKLAKDEGLTEIMYGIQVGMHEAYGLEEEDAMKNINSIQDVNQEWGRETWDIINGSLFDFQAITGVSLDNISQIGSAVNLPDGAGGGVDAVPDGFGFSYAMDLAFHDAPTKREAAQMRSIIWHEAGHIVEIESGLYETSKQFLLDRSNGEQMSKHMAHAMYGGGEVYIGAFHRDYVGKDYSGENEHPSFGPATEVISTGMEMLSNSNDAAHLLLLDPDHFFLTMGAIAKARKYKYRRNDPRGQEEREPLEVDTSGLDSIFQDFKNIGIELDEDLFDEDFFGDDGDDTILHRPTTKRKDADRPWDEKKVVRGRGGKFAKKPAPATAPQQKTVDRATAKTETIKAVEGWAEKKFGADRVRAANMSMKRNLKGTRVLSRTTLDGIIGILNNGAMRTQFETGSSMGTYAPMARLDGFNLDAERAMFDNRGDATEKDKAPIYGYISHPDYPDADGSVGSYGEVVIEMKEEVRDRTTITSGDSFGLSYLPSPLSDPSVASCATFHRGGWDSPSEWDESVLGDSRIQEVANANNFKELRGYEGYVSCYMEAQIHGGVKTADIKSINYNLASYSSEDYFSAPWIHGGSDINRFLDAVEKRMKVMREDLPETEDLPKTFDKKIFANVSAITKRGIDFPTEESPVDPQKVGEALDEYYLNEAPPYIAKRLYPEEEREAIKARTVAMLSSAKSMDEAVEIEENAKSFQGHLPEIVISQDVSINEDPEASPRGLEAMRRCFSMGISIRKRDVSGFTDYATWEIRNEEDLEEYYKQVREIRDDMRKGGFY